MGNQSRKSVVATAANAANAANAAVPEIKLLSSQHKSGMAVGNTNGSTTQSHQNSRKSGASNSSMAAFNPVNPLLGKMPG